MNARQLLECIEARGGVATVKRDGDAAKINVVPRHVALDFASDIQRFKPALLELLDGTATATPATRAPSGDGAALLDGATVYPLDFKARAAYWRLSAKRRGLNRSAQVERARASIDARFVAMLERADTKEGREGAAGDAWALGVALALLDAGKSPE
jgi:hypothetical protein